MLIGAWAYQTASRLDRLDFSLTWRGRRLRVDVRPHETTYSLRTANGDSEQERSMPLRHHGQLVEVECGQPVTLPVPPPTPVGPAPQQPPGRAPVRRIPEPET